MKTKNQNMRMLFFITLIILFTGTNIEYSAAQDADMVKQIFMQQLNVEVNAVSHPAFEGVFLPSIYEAEFSLFENHENRTRSFDYTVFATNSDVIRIYKPSTSKSLPFIKKMIDPEFRLNENTAPSLKQALMGLFDEDFFADNEVNGETIRRDNNEWHFLTGKFFDYYKGLVFTVSDNGTVQKVEQDLKLIQLSE